MAVDYRFTWIEDEPSLRAHARDFIGLINASVADDGMLGYASTLSAAEEQALIGTWAAQVSAGLGHLLLIADGEGACGMLHVRTNANANYRHIADLSKGFLARRARGSSALRDMFRTLCARGRALGVELFTLDTRQGSRAERVWEHLGFRTWGVLDDYSRVLGRSYRGVYMSQTRVSLEHHLTRTTGQDTP